MRALRQVAPTDMDEDVESDFDIETRVGEMAAGKPRCGLCTCFHRWRNTHTAVANITAARQAPTRRPTKRRTSKAVDGEDGESLSIEPWIRPLTSREVGA